MRTNRRNRISDSHPGVLGGSARARREPDGPPPPDGHRSPLVLAKVAYEKKDWTKAADFARMRLKVDGGDPEALRLLARSSIRLGRDAAGAAIYNDRWWRRGCRRKIVIWPH